MGKKRGRPAKDKFADLPESFREEVYAADADGIKAISSKVALENAQVQSDKDKDEHYKAAKAAAQAAGAFYRETAKMTKLKLDFIRQTKAERGLA